MNRLSNFAQQTPQTAANYAFNALGWENFADPQLGGIAIDRFFGDNDGPTHAIVENLISDIGL